MAVADLCTGTGASTNNHCHERSRDGSIRMFVIMTILFVFRYLLSTVSLKCTALTPTKKIIVNFVISTLVIFTIITVWYSGVIPNEALQAKRDADGEFYKAVCTAESGEGYVVNGFPWVTKGRPHYLHNNIDGSTAAPDADGDAPKIGWDSENNGNPLRDEERHFYHLMFSFGVGAIIAAIASLKSMVGGGGGGNA